MRQKITDYLLFVLLLEGVVLLTILLAVAVYRMLIQQ